MRWLPGAIRQLSSRRALHVAIGVCVGLRIAAIFAVGTGGTQLYEFGTIGKNLEAGRGYSFYAADAAGRVSVDESRSGRPIPSAFMPPLYTFTVAGALEMTSSDREAIRALQALNVVAAAAGTVAMYALGCRLAGPVAGALGALAFASYGPFVYQATQASAANLYIPLELGTLALLVASVGSARLRRVAAAAAALGLVSLLRAEATALIGLGSAWIGWTARSLGPRAMATRVALFVVVAAILPTAWMARNATALDRFTPLVTTSGGFNLWVGNHAGASGSQKSFPEESAALERRLDQVPPTDSYELERDRVYRDEALDDITDDPLAALARAAKKLLLMATFDIYDERSLHPVNVLGWMVLAPLGAMGIIRRSVPMPARVLLAGYLAFSALVPVAFFALGRFKLAIEFPLILFASAYLAPLLARRADRAAVPVAGYLAPVGTTPVVGIAGSHHKQ